METDQTQKPNWLDAIEGGNVAEETRKIWQSLSPEERGFVSSYLENGGNPTQAFQTAFKKSPAESLDPWSFISKTKVKKLIKWILEDAELTKEKALIKIKEGLEATQMRRMRVNPGERSRHVPIPDYRIRAVYLDMLLKVLGLYKTPIGSISSDGQGGVVVLPAVQINTEQINLSKNVDQGVGERRKVVETTSRPAN
jgi:hypothetical protein